MFFQNVFDQEFVGNWTHGRQFALSFKIAPARRLKNLICSTNIGPFDLSSTSNRILSLSFAYNKDFKSYSTISVDISGVSPSETSTSEIVTILNNNTAFSDRFLAVNNGEYLSIQQKANNNVILRFYIENTGAESQLKFNKYSGISELPLYFQRHTITNRRTFNDSCNQLIALGHEITSSTVASPTVITSINHGLTTGDSILIVNSNTSPTINGTRTVTVTGNDTFTIPVNVSSAGTRGFWMTNYEQELISESGLTPSEAKEDWELLNGSYNMYQFQNNTIDGSNRITQSILYNAGAGVGDLAIKKQYTYSGSNTNPTQITEVPYVLKISDLVIPG